MEIINAFPASADSLSLAVSRMPLLEEISLKLRDDSLYRALLVDASFSGIDLFPRAQKSLIVLYMFWMWLLVNWVFVFFGFVYIYKCNPAF